MSYKGGIFQSWRKKQTVALQKPFFETLPKFPTTTESKADIAWLIYDLEFNNGSNKFDLVLSETICAAFGLALLRITPPEPGNARDLINILQTRPDEHLNKNSPDAPSLTDITSS